MSGYDKRVITLDKTVREWEQRYNELSGKVVAMENVSHFHQHKQILYSIYEHNDEYNQ